MPIVVIVVARPVAELHKHQHNDVGQEIGQRMHSVGYHGSRPAHNARHKLKHQQHRVDDASSYGNTVYGLFSLTVGIGFFHQCFDIKGLQLQI